MYLQAWLLTTSIDTPWDTYTNPLKYTYMWIYKDAIKSEKVSHIEKLSELSLIIT